jgi:hypothetical protein
MKKKLIITVTAAAIFVVTGSFLSVKHFAEKPVTKNINVEIFKTASYISPAY